MSDNSLSTRFPEGIQTPNVSGLKYLSLEKNFTLDTTSAALKVLRKSNEYNFVADEGNVINGIYIVDISLNKKRFNIVIAASGQLSSANLSSDSIDNSINILSSMNEDPSIFKFKGAYIAKRNGNQNVGLIISMTAISGLYSEALVEITSMSAQGRLNPSVDYPQFTELKNQRKYGYVNAIEVKDSSNGVNIDLNEVVYSSVASCNPATAGSRPNTDGIGICYTISGTNNTSIGAQLFIDLQNDMYYRSRNNGVYGFWTQVFTSKRYPRAVAGGSDILSLNGSTPVTISVPNIDLSQSRYIINASPEKILTDCQGFQIVSRTNGGFGVVAKSPTTNTWNGKVNWVVYESKPSESDVVLGIRMGILQGSLFTESTQISEGQTLRVIVSANGLANGESLAYNFTQISQSDVDGSLSGYVTIQNNQGIVDLPIVQDFLPESTETLRFTLAATNTFKEISVLDVSGPPEYKSRVSRFSDGSTTITQANEGDTVYLMLESKYVANGTSFTFSSSSDSDIENIVEFGAARNINNNLIVVPVKFEADATKPYEGTETITLNVLLAGVVVTSTNIQIVDTAWKAECWYSTASNGSTAITQANEGDTVYFVLRVPSGTTQGTFFKPNIKTVGTTGNIVEGDDVDITNSNIVAQSFNGNIILSQKIVIRADRKTEGDEILYMEWVNQSTSSIVADSNKPLLIKDTSTTPIQNLYISGEVKQDVDLKTLFETQFGTQDVPWICNLYVTGESWFEASATNKFAVTSDNWLAGTVVNLYWNSTGGIIGKGGQGADPKVPRVGAVGGNVFNIGSGHTLNINLYSGNVIVASGGGGGGGVTINGKYVGGGGGAATGLGGTADYAGSQASRLLGAQGGTYTHVDEVTSVTTDYIGGKGGDLGMAGAVSTSTGVNTAAGAAGLIKSGGGTLVLKKDGVTITSSQYYNANSFIRGNW